MVRRVDCTCTALGFLLVSVGCAPSGEEALPSLANGKGETVEASAVRVTWEAPFTEDYRPWMRLGCTEGTTEHPGCDFLVAVSLDLPSDVAASDTTGLELAMSLDLEVPYPMEASGPGDTVQMGLPVRTRLEEGAGAVVAFAHAYLQPRKFGEQYTLRGSLGPQTRDALAESGISGFSMNVTVLRKAPNDTFRCHGVFRDEAAFEACMYTERYDPCKAYPDEPLLGYDDC